MEKADIVRRLQDIARFLQWQGAGPFEVLAFRKGVESLQALGRQS
ncbi:MAG: hypothetical protein OEN20_07035 [Gammaproteobacteria bacterium]|nr:hypothetical protein [Gammaproteobacteria bacterium]